MSNMCLKKGMEATYCKDLQKLLGVKSFLGDKPWQSQGLGPWIYTNDQCLWPLVDWSNQKYVIQSMCIFWPCKKTSHFLLYRFRMIQIYCTCTEPGCSSWSSLNRGGGCITLNRSRMVGKKQESSVETPASWVALDSLETLKIAPPKRIECWSASNWNGNTRTSWRSCWTSWWAKMPLRFWTLEERLLGQLFGPIYFRLVAFCWWMVDGHTHYNLLQAWAEDRWWMMKVFFLPGHLYDEVLDGGVGTSNNFWKGKKSTKVLWHRNLHTNGCVWK